MVITYLELTTQTMLKAKKVDSAYIIGNFFNSTTS